MSFWRIIKQLAGNFLAVNPEFVPFQFDGTPYGLNEITVLANVSWMVSANQSWITVFPSSGTNNAAFTVYCDFNPDLYNPRNGVVTVSGGGISREIYIQQDAGEPV